MVKKIRTLDELTDFDLQGLVQGINQLIEQVCGEPHLFVMVVADEKGHQMLSNGKPGTEHQIQHMLLISFLQARLEPPSMGVIEIGDKPS